MDGRVLRLLLGGYVVGLAVSITLAQTALAVLTLRWLYRLATGRTRAGWPLALPFGAFIAASLAAAALSSSPPESLMAAKGLLSIAGFYVVLDALDETPAADRFVGSLLAVAAVISVVAILQVTLCPWLPPQAAALGRVARKCHRAHAFYSIYMTLAGVLSLVLLSALARLLPPARSPRRTRAWRALAWLLSGAALAFTYVRGAWVGFLAGMAVLIALNRRGRGLAAAGLVVLVLIVLVFPGVRQRAESIIDPSDLTARDRLSMWRSGLAMAQDHPLIGIGPGHVKRAYARYASADALSRSRGHLHNTPLQILVERGVIGLAAWLAIFAAFFWQAGRVLRALSAADGLGRALVTGSMAAIAGFLVGGLTEHNFGDSEVVMVAYAVMAVPFVVGRSVRG